MGRAIKELGLRREDLVVSTKLITCSYTGINDKFLSRKHLVEGCKNSLKRLQLDYVDVLYAHRPIYETPLEETCKAMHQLIEDGLTFYWGTSEWPADWVARAIGICERLGLHKPIVEQCEYSMLRRDNMEKGLRRVFESYKLGTTVWSPLASGILSGKYNDGNVPEDSRFGAKKIGGGDIENWVWTKYMDPKIKDDTCKKLRALADLAKEHGYTQPQMCLAWVIANTDVSTAILGFSRVSQIEENLKAIEMMDKWTPELDAKCTEILANSPEFDMDW
jgi:aryl-alcohol dehydrogenase-like predicted oxidoreductase